LPLRLLTRRGKCYPERFRLFRALSAVEISRVVAWLWLLAVELSWVSAHLPSRIARRQKLISLVTDLMANSNDLFVSIPVGELYDSKFWVLGLGPGSVCCMKSSHSPGI
jgi:hypothetical protein